ELGSVGVTVAVAHHDDRDARVGATGRAGAQGGLGQELAVDRGAVLGVVFGGPTAADEVDAHASTTDVSGVAVTGGSADHGKMIQSSVSRQVKSGTCTVRGLVYSVAVRTSPADSRRMPSTRARVWPESE